MRSTLTIIMRTFASQFGLMLVKNTLLQLHLHQTGGCGPLLRLLCVLDVCVFVCVVQKTKKKYK